MSPGLAAAESPSTGSGLLPRTPSSPTERLWRPCPRLTDQGLSVAMATDDNRPHRVGTPHTERHGHRGDPPRVMNGLKTTFLEQLRRTLGPTCHPRVRLS